MRAKSEIVIFGAGRWGKAALAYYKGRSPIAGFIDNDSSIWGSKIEGVPVYSPEILKEKPYGVVIAVKNHLEEIKKELYQKYGVQKAVFFRIDLIYDALDEMYDASTDLDEIIVKFQGGLGNQMFQYVVYKILEAQGKKVRADLFSYIITNEKKEEDAFILPDVFPGIKITECHPGIRRKYLSDFAEDCECSKRYKYVEPILPAESYAEDGVLDRTTGFLEGFFQTYKYAQLIKEELKKVFRFRPIDDKIFHNLIDAFQKKEFVGVHIRRGGYSSRTGQIVFGNSCNDDYYAQALLFLETKIKPLHVCFFSDNISWVKEHYTMENAIYIEPDMFDQYEDWYDMCLMSHCKHNIIANSTFSWWGAWLNANPEKIVIAPKRWVRKEGAMQDICPPEWIRI